MLRRKRVQAGLGASGADFLGQVNQAIAIKITDELIKLAYSTIAPQHEDVGVLLQRLPERLWNRAAQQMLDARDEVNAYRKDCRRYIVESDEVLSAFLELEATLL